MFEVLKLYQPGLILLFAFFLFFLLVSWNIIFKIRDFWKNIIVEDG